MELICQYSLLAPQSILLLVYSNQKNLLIIKKKNKKRKNPSLVEQLKKDREFEEQEALKPYNPETMNWQTYLDRKVSAEMKIENKKKKKKGRRNN